MFGKLVQGKDTYYFVSSTSGLAFKLNMVIIGQGTWKSDLGKIHDEVNRVNGLVKNEAEQCLATLGFLPAAWDAAKATNPSLAEMIGGKTRCFIYLPKAYSEDYLKEYTVPYGFPEMSFIWNGSNNSVYTPYTDNNLGWRYKAIQEAQIPPLGTTPPPAPNPDPDPDPIPTTGGYLHLQCPHCGKKIF